MGKTWAVLNLEFKPRPLVIGAPSSHPRHFVCLLFFLPEIFLFNIVLLSFFLSFLGFEDPTVVFGFLVFGST